MSARSRYILNLGRKKLVEHVDAEGAVYKDKTDNITNKPNNETKFLTKSEEVNVSSADIVEDPSGIHSTISNKPFNNGFQSENEGCVINVEKELDVAIPSTSHSAPSLVKKNHFENELYTESDLVDPSAGNIVKELVPSSSVTRLPPIMGGRDEQSSPSSNTSEPFVGGSSDEYMPSEEDDSESDNHNNQEVNISPPKIKSRWKKSDPSKWKKNMVKKRRSLGQPYKSAGKDRPPKVPREIDCSHCKYQCTQKIDLETRKTLCMNYWKLDYLRKKDFLLSCVKATAIKCRKPRTQSRTAKNMSRYYYFKKGEEEVRVCKSFFLKTLCISHGPVDKAFEGRNEYGSFDTPDKRGKKEPFNKTPDSDIQEVKNHIESFPAMESHYCRKSSQRKYLDPSLSITKMYSLYCSESEKNNKRKVSEAVYRKVFCTEYNLSFFKPKKDQCSICDKYKSDLISEHEYREHLRRRDEANLAKAHDKKRASDDKAFVSATFDLQSVLQIPSSEVSQMYYSMKLNAFNLTIYEAAPPNNAFCFAWTEVNGQRGSSEIGTALFQWINTLPQTVTEISLFSDSCSGQNRNQYIASLLLFVVQNTNIEKITHSFLEKGHTYMEVDSMHSAIEKAKQNVGIYTMNDLLNIFKIARSNRLRNKKSCPYKCKELRFGDMLDLKKLASSFVKNRLKDENGEKVSWLKIKVMIYEKNKPGEILFKYNYSDAEFKLLNVFGREKTRLRVPTEISQLYKGQLPITAKKKDSLLKLCKQNDIPPEYHAWYEALPVNKNAKNRIPEPITSDSGSEDTD